MDGVPWTSDGPGGIVESIAGAGARLVRDDSADRFDILPLLVATDGAIAAFGYEGRRLRPNLVIGGVEELEERTWEGRCLRIGSVLIGIENLRGRCVMTTFDPDTLEQDRQVLISIVRRFDGKLALNAFVIRGGTVHEGDQVELPPAGGLPRAPDFQLATNRAATSDGFTLSQGQETAMGHTVWGWPHRGRPHGGPGGISVFQAP